MRPWQSRHKKKKKKKSEEEAEQSKRDQIKVRRIKPVVHQPSFAEAKLKPQERQKEEKKTFLRPCPKP
jgi:homoaconitase/3-isopropylmalate dehydratase large subunit